MGERAGGAAPISLPMVAYQTIADAIQARQLQTELADYAVMHPVLEFLGRRRTVDDLARVERTVLAMLKEAS
jgi:hypothetical protein